MYSRNIFPDERTYQIYKAVWEMQESLRGPHDGYPDEVFAAKYLAQQLKEIDEFPPITVK